MDIKNKLICVMNNCLDILRPDGLVNEKALGTISYFLILKLLEPHFGSEINIDDYDYDFESYFEENVIEQNKNHLPNINEMKNELNKQIKTNNYLHNDFKNFYVNIDLIMKFTYASSSI